MKPSSALILDQDGIILLHRAQDGWRVIGQADPSDPDLDQNMQYLRRTALELAAGKFATKLVIPNSQILYTQLDLPPVEGERLASDVRAALEGLTPYEVDELAFDWQENTPGKIEVAVVAEETLAEAEAFAERHKFNPLCFVSIPDSGGFEGEPSFGQAAAAHRLLSPGAKVEANVAPIDVKALIARHDEDQAGVDAPKRREDIEHRDAAQPNDAAPTFSSRRPEAEAGSTAPVAPLDLKFVAPQLADDRPVAVRPMPGPTAPQPGAPTFSSNRSQASPTGAAAATLPIPLDVPQTAPLATPQQESAEPDNAPETQTAPAMGETLKPANSPAPAKKVTAMQRPQNLRLNSPKPAPAPEKAGSPFVFAGIAAVLAVALALGIAWWLRGSEQSGSGANADFVAEGTRASTGVATDPLTLIEPLDGSATGGETPAANLPSGQTGNELAGQTTQGLPDLSNLPAITQSGVLQLSPEVVPPPEPDRIDRLYVASIDRVVLTYDAIALPSGAFGQTDVLLPTQPLPPARGSQFVFDENGLVVPSPTGTLTPEGIRVFAGSPAVLPAIRPGTTVATTTQAALSAERLDQLSRILPLPRPEGLAEGTERARNAGLSLAELGTIRPVPRPTVVEEAAALAANTEPTEQAVLASLTPAPRPRNLVAAPAAATQTAAAVAPRQPVPSGATVAQAATIENALRLRSVNVIGIYGTAKQRRALVRLANGRIVMVSVGERLDGGRVAAINENTLVYVKSGRNISLTVPNG